MTSIINLDARYYVEQEYFRYKATFYLCFEDDSGCKVIVGEYDSKEQAEKAAREHYMNASE